MRQPRAIVMGSLALLVPWVLATAYTLNFYYLSGAATLLDSGWFVALESHGTALALPNPPVVITGSFYATHVSPVLAVLRLLHDAIWTGPDAAWFCVCQGAWYGIIGLAIWLALRGASAPLALPAAWLTALGGAELATLGFPHFEVAIPAMLILFLVLRAGNRWASLLLLPLLAVREDAGLHAAMVLGLVGLCLVWQAGRRTPAAYPFLLLAVLLTGGSLISMAVHGLLFGNGPNALRDTYIGNPPLAHLTPMFLRRRLADLTCYRAYLFVPLALILAAALLTRDKLLLVGPLSCLGWLLPTIIARTHQAGLLWGYYAFPLMPALAWPAIRQRLRPRPTGGMARLQLLASLLSIALFAVGTENTDPRPWRRFVPPSWSTIKRTEAALDAVLARQASLGRLVADDAVGSLRIEAFDRNQLRVGFRFTASEDRQVDTLFAAATPPSAQAERQARMIEASGLVNRFPVPGTALILRTRTPIQDTQLRVLLDLESSGGKALNGMPPASTMRPGGP